MARRRALQRVEQGRWPGVAQQPVVRSVPEGDRCPRSRMPSCNGGGPSRPRGWQLMAGAGCTRASGVRRVNANDRSRPGGRKRQDPHSTLCRPSSRPPDRQQRRDSVEEPGWRAGCMRIELALIANRAARGSAPLGLSSRSCFDPRRQPLAHPSEVLRCRCEQELVMRSAEPTQPQPVELQDPFEVGEEHLHLLAFAH